MTTRYTKACDEAVREVSVILGQSWELAADQITKHIEALCQVVCQLAADLRARPPLISQFEFAKQGEKLKERLSSAINFYQPIGIATAEQATEAAWAALMDVILNCSGSRSI